MDLIMCTMSARLGSSSCLVVIRTSSLIPILDRWIVHLFTIVQSVSLVVL